jgi:predicted 3-demethylubiquinone-9 3-methyltransferase (glyoxalase superfamily)
MQNITPFLWFDDDAEEAANYYVSLFKNSKIEHISRYGDAGPREKGSVMTVSFNLDGTDFIALNGGRRHRDGSPLDPSFELSASSAVSFFVNCPTQDEVDRLWAELTQGGTPMQCGWIRDKYGVTWQIVPDGLIELISSDDEERSTRAMRAMFEMEKLDVNAARRAYYGEETTAK